MEMFILLTRDQAEAAEVSRLLKEEGFEIEETSSGASSDAHSVYGSEVKPFYSLRLFYEYGSYEETKKRIIELFGREKLLVNQEVSDFILREWSETFKQPLSREAEFPLKGNILFFLEELFCSPE